MSRRQKIGTLILARTQFAGVGTRKAKLVLNKLAKGDEYALALRVALEIEDVNLTAKRYFGGDCGGYTYADINYLKKGEQIEALIEICKSQGWVFGVHDTGAVEQAQNGLSGPEDCSQCNGSGTCDYGRSDHWCEPEPGYVPSLCPCDKCGGSGKSKHAIQRRQQQTHVIYFDIPGVGQLSWYYSPKQQLPVYPGQWDGQEGSTLPKLEAAIAALLTESVAA
jgi:hypothetical protein